MNAMRKTKTALLGTLLSAVWTATTLAATTFTIVRLTDSAGCSREPSIDGGGNRVAFASEADLTGGNADGNFEIFLRDRKKNVVTQITSSSGGNTDKPSISKGGARIAFVSDRDLVTGSNMDGNAEIFVWDKKKGISQITNTTGGSNDAPVVTNSGVQMALVSDRDLVPGSNADGNSEIFFLGKKGFVQITNTTGTSQGSPAVNNNGARMAFVATADLVPGSNADGSQEVFFFDRKKGFRQVTAGPTTCASSGPAINQAGTRIAFASTCDLVPPSNMDGNEEIFVFDAKHGLTQVTDTTGGCFSLFPATDAAGKRIAFMSTCDLVSGENSDGNIEAFLSDPKKGFFQLSHTVEGQPQVAGAPSVSNNGKRIAYEVNGDTSLDENVDEKGEIYVAVQD